MDIRFLESFLSVVERGSIADAARHLGITPAAVSQRIKALEDQIRQPLLTRAGRTVVPTSSGCAILDKSREIISSVTELKRIAGHDTLAGNLHIGAISSALTGLLPLALNTFFAENPNVELRVTPGQSLQLYDDVFTGRLDGAVIVEPPFPVPKTCGWIRLRSEPMIVLTSEKCEMTDPIEVLKSHLFLRYDRNQWGGRIVDNFLRQQGIVPKSELDMDALEAISIMVSHNIGVALLPDWAPPWPSGLSVRKLTLPDDCPQRHIGFLWTLSSSNSDAIRKFRENIVSCQF
ncbi:LysR family transcriptional regulator [Gluconacetobacter sp. 1b LMG 1731]|uniref:LysR family transcriptional regulator n=2 Tax=Acetobacteraceae TaxID=433 RepID=A0A7W4IJI6_9PROT|nr:LysR family transcriptional regulator [Gluconacetobacter dulcium]MBB2193128.1 LysR family transcriptional regulator [Gluconacetobacter dulcium]